MFVTISSVSVPLIRLAMCIHTYLFFIMVLANVSFYKLQVIGSSSSSHSNMSILTPASHNQSPLPKYSYLVKIVNPKKKSEFEVQSLKAKQKFLCFENLKEQVVLDCKEKVPNPLTVIGYTEPEHGLTGKKKWLTSDYDLIDMYEASKG